jgi:transcriptional regulator with XRE-family HTH domain
MPILDPERLRYEMHIRGLSGDELARRAGLNKNTHSRGLAGKPVTMGTLRRITSALLTQLPLRVMADLIARPVAKGSSAEKG